MDVASGRLSAYSPGPTLPFDRSGTPGYGTPPPPFTPGNYHDPVFDKLFAAATHQHDMQTYDPQAKRLEVDDPEGSAEESGESGEWVAH